MIKFDKTPEMIPFKKVIAGEIFTYGENVFMKTNHIFTNQEFPTCLNAINLCTGGMIYAYPDMPVIRVNEMNIKYKREE